MFLYYGQQQGINSSNIVDGVYQACCLVMNPGHPGTTWIAPASRSALGSGYLLSFARVLNAALCQCFTILGFYCAGFPLARILTPRVWITLSGSFKKISFTLVFDAVAVQFPGLPGSFLCQVWDCFSLGAVCSTSSYYSYCSLPGCLVVCLL